ncbi:MAG: TrbI/VirB10 family protein [Rivularia sp. (in: cyanobacteria)]
MNNNQENHQNELLDDELTPEEELEISGYQPEQVALIDQEFLIEQDNEQAEPQSGSENPLVRFAIASAVVGGVMGFGWMIWSIFFSPKPVVKAPIPKPTSKVIEKEESSEAARLKAELALRNQASRNLEQPEKEVPPPPKPKPSKPVRTARKPKPSKPRIIREKVPSPPRIIRETVPSPPKIIRETVPSPPKIIREKVPNKTQPKNTVAKTLYAPSPTKIEKVDPFERWNKLATLGQQTTSQRNNFSNNNQSFEQAQSLPDKSEPKSNYPAAHTESNSSKVIFANATNRVKEPQTSTISTVKINGSNDLNRNQSENQTPGEWGILNRTPPNLQQETITASNSPIQVQIGTSAEASVIVPIIWSEEDNNQERFAVELQEDVLSIDKRVALAKGTILITEIHSVSKINRLVKQSVVAVVYKDSSGRVQQKTIPKNTILIRGEKNKPLLAKSISDKGKAIAQQDILIGLLGAAGRAGEVLNQNQNQSSTVISNNGFSSQTFNTKAKKPNLLAAAVEGFFKPMSQRLSQRANKASNEIMNRPDVAVVPAGTKVSVVFSNFFEVRE